MATAGRGPHLRNPILYVLSRPEAKAMLYRLAANRQAEPYEDLRRAIGLAPETFHRLTRRLSQFDLIRMHAPRGAAFEGRRIRVVVEVSPKGRRLLALMREVDQLVRDHAPGLGREAVRSFFEAEA